MKTIIRVNRKALFLIISSSPYLFAANLCIVSLVGLSTLLVTYANKQIFDHLGLQLTGKSWQTDTLLVWSFVYVVLFIVQEGLNPLRNFIDNELGRKFSLFIELNILKKINSFPGITQFENPEFYDKIVLAKQGATSSANQLVPSFFLLLQAMFTVIGVLVIVLTFSTWLSVIIIASLIPQIVFELRIVRRRFGVLLGISYEDRLSYVYSDLMTDPNLVKEIKFLNISDYLLDKFTHIRRKVDLKAKALDVYEFKWQLLLGVLRSLIGGGALGLVIYQSLEGHLSLGTTTLYIAAVGTLQMNLSQIIHSLVSLGESSLNFMFYEELINLPHQMPDRTTYGQVMPLQSEIEVRNVWFRYPGQQDWVLKGINLTIPVGEAVALVGFNGSGKTTLVKLLLRLFEPEKGQILWDGVDIREFDINLYRQNIATIFQDFVRYELSVCENIGVGDVQSIDNKERIKSASQKGDAASFINALPNKYSSLLTREFFDEEGHAGVNLSGGQWQKIALSRMFMRDASLYVLDEPSSALDPQAELEALNQYATAVKTKTSLLISHRLNSVKLANKIFVLEKGIVTEHGSHENLLRINGTYAKLFMAQYNSYAHVNGNVS